MSEKLLKITLKIAALFLWYFVLIFWFIIWDMGTSTPLLKEGTFIGDLMIRFPYQWDYELMFAGLFLVWGIFVWKSAQNLTDNKIMIRFTAWAFLVHALCMIIIGIITPSSFVHLVTDSVPWFLISFGILYLNRKRSNI